MAFLNRYFFSFVLAVFFSAANANTSVEQQWLEKRLAIAEEKSIESPTLAVTYLNKILKDNSLTLTEVQRIKLQVMLAENYLLNSDMNKALVLVKQIQEHHELLDETSAVSYFIVKSDIYLLQGEYKLALAELEKAKEKIPLLDDKTKGNLYAAFANYHVSNHNESKAKNYYYKAYKVFLQSGDDLQLAYIESTMSQSYEALYDFDKAIELQKKALSYFSSKNLSFDMMVSYYHLAKIYLKLSRNSDVIFNAEQILKINAKSDSSSPKFNYYAYITLTQAYLQLGNIEQSVKFLNLSNQFVAGIEDVYKKIDHLLIQAEIELTQLKLEQASQTVAKINKILSNVPAENTVTLLLRLKKLKAKISIKKSDFERATQEYQSYITLNEQHYNYIRELFRSQSKAQFDVKKLELEKQLLEKDKELNEFALLEIKQEQALHHSLIFSVLMLALVLLIFAWRQYRLKRKFTVLANTDYLTGVANRRKVMDFAEQQWLELKPGCNRFALISFDLDHFKKVNDNYGHPAGDLVLKTIVTVAQQAIREHDFLGRIGGEEFLVVLVDTDQVEATEIAYRIKSAIEKAQINSEQHIIKVTASLGVTQKSTQTNTFKDLLKQADKALYTAKENGRNRVEIYE
ncbi:GGDEF domain-containing protein [Pseudoalteromonas shioyasakiensis]|uniref:tetratricopeptide repeat-containing diguanylate cyclase n=1 Tax=Pseudoalteromonas shioyasakiensis TaxID=1190813 RepID=UPI00211791B1|nr:GGDEF domain-containing protein [Pseudoalteromonas shioyasakiensis]MCQ8878121.1 GGDEF domain-containing protein [Pseudoalteromonas shioyasakiensis]